MITPGNEVTTDPHHTIAELRQRLDERTAERDAALAREAMLAEALATRNTEFGERIEQQSATIDVLKVMSASPGDPQPVFDLIAGRARAFCQAEFGAVTLVDDDAIRLLALAGADAWAAQVRAAYPAPITPASAQGRAILTRSAVRITDTAADPHYTLRGVVTVMRSVAVVPMLRNGMPIGGVGIGRSVTGPFSDIQIELLKTFAEQAVIAITSAETYRTLQTRTADLQESLEYQTAISDVLNVISRSSFDLKPMLEKLLSIAIRLCNADDANLSQREADGLRILATRSALAEWAAALEGRLLPEDRSSVNGRAVLARRPVQIVDAANDPDYTLSGAVAIGHSRTCIGVPLLRDGVVIGAIGLARRRVEPFTDRQIDLVRTFADQAVIAIENTRLIAEQREALEQQTATAEVLQVINRSPGDLAPVFDAMLEKAVHLCESEFGILNSYDGECFRVVATRGVGRDLLEHLREPFRSGPGTALFKIAQGGTNIVHIADITDDDGYRLGDLKRKAVADVGGARSQLMVALRKDGKLLGAINVYRKEVRPFSGKHVALLENFAAQAVIAMENARLLTEQREALEQQTATAEVLQVINVSPGNLQPVFDAMLEKAMRLCEAAFGVLFTSDGESFTEAASRGIPSEYAEFRRRNTQIPTRLSTARQLLRDGANLLHIADMKADAAYLNGEPIRRALVDLGGARTGLWVALRKDDALRGAIMIYRQEVRPFSEREIALLENFAAQAVIAMENARLLNEVRQRQEELRITFENMGDGVAMFDETPRLVAWNRKFQELLDVPDAVLAERRTYADYIRYLTERGEYGPDTHTETQLRHFQERMREHYSFERTRPDGRVIEVRHNPVPGDGFVLIYADITERKRNEAEIHAARDAAEAASRTIEAAYRDLKAAQANLIQAEKMASLGQLTAGIAHEIKNPLNFVNNFAELSVDLLGELKDAIAPAEAALNPDQRDEMDAVVTTLTSNLEKITEHGKRADGIVKAMLEHSRGSSGERRMVDLNALIDEALNLAYHGARAQDQSFNITLERDFGEGIAPIEVNPQDMTRVFLNLLSNAFYATTRRARDGGAAGFEPTLKVSTRGSGEAVEIRVRDNGIGIPVDIRDKLFQPFFTTKPTGEGTGLGLSITYDIVTKQHGGTITVDSEVDAFTEFVVALPRQCSRTVVAGRER